MKTITKRSTEHHTSVVQKALSTTYKDHEIFGQYDDGRFIIPKDALHRPHGSYVSSLILTAATGIETRLTASESFDFLNSLRWNHVTDEAIELECAMTDDPDAPEEEIKNVKYYAARSDSFEYNAYEAVMPIEQIDPESIKDIRVQLSHHSGRDKNYELVMNMPPRPTSIIHIIIGNCYDDFSTIRRVVYTWYPGQLTAPMTTGITGKATVKLQG